ncbi:hypothetical protein BCR43DRAFT_560526 [Syncephalastrum racemosum]|uniref:DHHA2 domain-containing protein n=1 Tax=Syncephalastrum racemosum TaxID=13706 RepID=A0A1X2HWI2_SYNRA|nr:hypothetical protein BCR43DRAFT_560526 [Syncephalastrum racemosum]
MAQAINTYLDTIRSHISTQSIDTPLTIVTGNDSADLDSILSSLLFAFLSTQANRQKGVPGVYVPLVKVPTEDLQLRPELEYVLGSAGVDYKKLVCINDLPLQSLPHAQVFLVDHNRLTPPFDSSWEGRVAGILDHHVDEKQNSHCPVRDIRMVGSCMTLVTEHFADLLQANPPYLHVIAEIALAPILVDTHALRWEFGKTTQSDVDAFQLLAKTLGSSEVDEKMIQYFNQISAIKNRVQHLSTRDLLRRDYKQFTVGPYRIGTSSMPWNFQEWIDRDGVERIEKDTLNYMTERDLDMEMVLDSFERNGYQRELAIFIAPNGRLAPVKEALEKNEEIQLKPYSEWVRNSSIGWYNQSNIKMSRKQVWPLAQSLIEELMEKRQE